MGTAKETCCQITIYAIQEKGEFSWIDYGGKWNPDWSSAIFFQSVEQALAYAREHNIDRIRVRRVEISEGGRRVDFY